MNRDMVKLSSPNCWSSRCVFISVLLFVNMTTVLFQNRRWTTDSLRMKTQWQSGPGKLKYSEKYTELSMPNPVLTQAARQKNVANMLATLRIKNLSQSESLNHVIRVSLNCSSGWDLSSVKPGANKDCAVGRMSHVNFSVILFPPKYKFAVVELRARDCGMHQLTGQGVPWTAGSYG